MVRRFLLDTDQPYILRHQPIFLSLWQLAAMLVLDDFDDGHPSVAAFVTPAATMVKVRDAAL